MKKSTPILVLILLLASIILPQKARTQTPQKMSYQAIIRDTDNELITDQDIGMQISILKGSSSGTAVYVETQTPTTNANGLVSIEIGEGTTTDDFSAIDWAAGTYFIKTETDPTGGTNYTIEGVSQLISVPYALFAGEASTAESLGTDGVYSTNTDTLFVVKDHDGNVVFAVFPDGAEVIVNETAKGKVGGFAVSGRSPSKTKDLDILRITSDSTRIYVNDDAETKAKVGGFAVSGRSPSKGTEQDYFNISGSENAEIIDPSEARILWYPNKEAFMAGRVLVESPDSVGLNSWATGFESKSIGDYSQALGYQAIARESNSTAIGNLAVVNSANSYAFGNNTYVGESNSYAIGNGANVTGEGSYAIGSGALASGDYSFALGSDGIDSAGIATNVTKALGDYSYAFGMGSIASSRGAFAMGSQDTASGQSSVAIGNKAKAIGTYNSVAIGYNCVASGNWSSFAFGNGVVASGDNATALGTWTEATGNFSTTMGWGTKASGEVSTAFGQFTTASGEASIAMGKSTNAIGWLSIAMGQSSTASGDMSVAMGNGTTASGKSSLSMGFGSIASGENAIAFGGGTASGFRSFANGYATASGDFSFAWGDWMATASGSVSVAIGSTVKARGKNTTAIGCEVNAYSHYETVIGFRNDTTYTDTTSEWVESTPLFTVANGYYGPKSALMVLKNGNVGIGGYPGATGRNALAIINTGLGYQPPSEPVADGILLFAQDVSESAELKVMDEAGNVTTLSPHNFSIVKKSEPMAWSFFSENKNIGYKINVDMLKAIRTIENLSGEKLVYLQDIETQEIVEEQTGESLIEIIEKQQAEIDELKQKLNELMILLEHN